MVSHIADICHNRHNWRWCLFFKPVPFFVERTRNFGQSWPIHVSCCEFTHFLVYFYRAKLCSRVPKLTNIRYGVTLCDSHNNGSVLSFPWEGLHAARWIGVCARSFLVFCPFAFWFPVLYTYRKELNVAERELLLSVRMSAPLPFFTSSQSTWQTGTPPGLRLLLRDQPLIVAEAPYD